PGGTMIALARWLLRRLLPADVRQDVLADLDTELAQVILPARTRGQAARWYWRHVIGSIAPALRMRLRRTGRLATDAARDERIGADRGGRAGGAGGRRCDRESGRDAACRAAVRTVVRAGRYRGPGAAGHRPRRSAVAGALRSRCQDSRPHRHARYAFLHGD